MKITKQPKRLAEASPEVKQLLDRISAVSDDELPTVLDQVSEWCWPRGDLHYWTGVLNRFDDILAAVCKEYDFAHTFQTKDFSTEHKKMLVSLLRFSRLLIENCTNRKLYDSYDHLNNLLLCRDIDVLEATVRLLLRPAQQFSSQSAGRSGPAISQARLATLALTWSPRDHGLDMASVARADAVIPEDLLGLRFQFYRRNMTTGGAHIHAEAGPSQPPSTPVNTATTTPARPSTAAPRGGRPTPAASTSVGSGLVAPADVGQYSEEGLTTISIKSIPALNKDPSAILRDIVEEYKVPPEDQYELYLKIRIAASMSNPIDRQRLLVCRLLAVACYSHITPEPQADVQLFLYEPDIVQKTASLAEVDSGLDEAVKSAALYGLDALGRFKSKLNEVLSSVSASVNHGTVLRTLQTVIEQLNKPDCPISEHLIDSLFGLIAFITSTTPGCNMIVGAGLIPLLVQLVNTCRSDIYMAQRTVSRSVGLIDSIVGSYQPSFQWFIEAHGLQTLVARVQHEVDSNIKHAKREMVEDGLGALYGKLSFGRASLLRSLLKTICHMMTSGGNADSLRGLIDSSLLDSTKTIMAEREVFGPQILALAINIVSAFIHNEPTSLAIIQERKIPELFFDLVEKDVEAISDVIGAIPNFVGAVCLNEAGLALFNSRDIITPMFSIFTSPRHLRVLLDRDNAAMFGAAIDELIRHQPSLKQRVLDAVLQVLDRIQELGATYTPLADGEDEQNRYGLELVPERLSSEHPTSSIDTASPTDNNAARSLALGDVVMDESDALRNKEDDVKGNDVIGFMDAIARFLDGLFQSASHCKDFLKSDGPEKLLRFVGLPCLPYNFATSMTADSLVSLLRFMTEVSPTTVLTAVLKETKRGLIETQAIWDRDPNVSSVASLLAPSNDVALAAANDKFRKLISLNSRLHLLADVLPSHAFTGQKSPAAFVQVLQAGVASPQLGQATLAELGDLHRVAIWENILVKAIAPALPKVTPESESAGESAVLGKAQSGDAHEPQPDFANNVVEDSTAAVEQEPMQAPTSPSAKEGIFKDPRIRNSAALRYVMSQLPVSLTSIFTEATRVLTPKRSPDAAQRRTAAQIADTIGKSLCKQMEPQESSNESNNLAFITMMIGHLTNVLYDDRTASVVVHTGVLQAFERAGGVDALLTLYNRYVKQLDDHFALAIGDGQDANETSLRLGHLCGGLKVTLNLLQNLSASRPLHDAPATLQMIAKDTPFPTTVPFRPHELLLRLRSAILPPVQATWNKTWLTKVPLSVNRSVMQTMLHILQAEGEDPPKPKSDALSPSGGTTSTGGAPHLHLGGPGSALSSFLGSLGGGTLAVPGGPLAGASSGSNALRRQPVQPDESRVQLLTDMGFPRGAARHALTRYSNNANAATEYLLAHPEIVGSMANEPDPEPPAPPAPPANESANEDATDPTPTTSDAPMASAEQNGDSASGSNDNENGNTPASAADGDVPMREATISGTADGDGSKSPSTSPNPKLEMLKAQLDELRKPLAANITLRGLELADHHETLVFDVKDSICIFAKDEGKTSHTLKALLENIHSVQPTAFTTTETATATRLHLLALILNEEVVLNSFSGELSQLACNVIGVLAADYEQRPQQDKHPKWLASLCLVASSVLSREEEPLEGRKPDKEASDLDDEPVKKPNRFEAESHVFSDFCLRILAKPDTVVNEEMLSLYRLLVLLTRNPHIAASLSSRNGVQTLLRPFFTHAGSTKNCQSYLIICLRHVVESHGLLKLAVQQELRAWFAQSRTQAVDAAAMLRGLSPAALRDPVVFMEVVKENVEMADFLSVKGTAVLRLVPLAESTTVKASGKEVADGQHSAVDKVFGDETFDGPPSPTKGNVDLDAQMDDLTKSIRDKDSKSSGAGQAATNSDADAVVQYLLSELLRTSRDRVSLWAQKLSRPGAAAASAETAKAMYDKEASVAALGAGDMAPTPSGAAAAPITSDQKSDEDDQLDSAYFYICFLMQCLTELTSSYVACKTSFINCSKKRLTAISSAAGLGYDASTSVSGIASSSASLLATPKHSKTMPGVLTLFLSELVPCGFTERIDDIEESRRRATISNWAMSSIVAMTADVGFHTSIKEMCSTLISIRKQILDAVARALKDAVSSTELIEIRYGRLYALADLCHRLLTARPNGTMTGAKQNEDLTLHIAKTMLEKSFVPLLTSALGDVDLNMPTVQSLLDAILRPLEHLTRIAIRAQSKNERGSRTFAETEEDDETFLDTMIEDAIVEREDTPDFYRSSALGMHTGEMGQDDSMEEDDEDELEDDEMEEMDYSGSEDGSDLSEETSDDDDDEDDDEEDSRMHETMVEVIEGDESGSSGEDDEESWTDDEGADEDDHSSGGSDEDALDFVVGADAADGGGQPALGEYDGLGWEGGMPSGGDMLAPMEMADDEEDDDEDDGATEDGDGYYGEEDEYEEDELDFLQDLGPPSRQHQTQDRFGANWAAGQDAAVNLAGSMLPPTFFMRPAGTDGVGVGGANDPAGAVGGGAVGGGSGVAARRPRPRAPPLVSVDPAAHPLLDDQREVFRQRQVSRRSRRPGAMPGYQDWAQSIDELIGGGAIELFDAIFGRAAGGPGALGTMPGGDAEIRFNITASGGRNPPPMHIDAAAFGIGPPERRVLPPPPLGLLDGSDVPGPVVYRTGPSGRVPPLPRVLRRNFNTANESAVAAVHSFKPASTMSRWADEERIIFGELAQERSGRLRNHVANVLMPRWKQSSGATNQQQKDELVKATGERKRILDELEVIRARLQRNQSELSGLRAEVDRQREPQGDSQTTQAQASAPSAEVASGVGQTSSSAAVTAGEDVEMTESSQALPQPQAAQAPLEGNVISGLHQLPHLELTSLQQGIRDLDSSGSQIDQVNPPLQRSLQGQAHTEQSASAAAGGSQLGDAVVDASSPNECIATDETSAREIFSINGRAVDITHLGMDREVLAALPTEMQEEVVSQALREHRAATVPGQEETSISPEFLDALPAELRAEVLEQEAAERAQTRREQAAAEARIAANGANAVNAPNTSAGAGAAPAGDGANAGAAQQEAFDSISAAPNTATRAQHTLADPSNSDVSPWLRDGSNESFSRHIASIMQHRRFGENGGREGQIAASGGDKAAPRDAIQLIDSNGIAALIRLLFFPTLNARQSGLHKVLANLSQNGKTRMDILSMLLRILSEGSTDVTAVDRSYASMSARAQGNTPGKPPVKRAMSLGVLQQPQAGGSNTSSAVAPLSRAGEEAPFLIASRSIETLLHLTTCNDQAAFYFLREDPRLAKKSKGKEKEKGSAPLNILLGLLEKPSILSNAQVVDSLIALLCTVTKPIPGLAAQAVKDKEAAEKAAEEEAKKSSEEERPVDSQTSSSAITGAALESVPATASTTTESRLSEQDGKEEKEKDAVLPISPADKPPQVAKERLAAVVRPLATPISSKGFQHTLAVASHLASIDFDSRQAVTEALQKEATAAVSVLSENLDMLLATLPPRKTAEEEEAEEKAQAVLAAKRSGSGGVGIGENVDVDGGQTEFQPRVDRKRITSSALPLLASPASAQARLLRSLRAIEWLHSGR